MERTDQLQNLSDGWKAALYLRLSKEDGDKEESDSITNQRELLLSYVQRNLPDVTVVDEKVDDGYSGATFDRPRFKQMMDDIIAGKVNCVIVKDLSRFGRNFTEAGKYIENIFPGLGVRFISVNDGVDSIAKKSRSDEIVVPFLNLISDAYCRDISIKIRSALETKRKMGAFVSAFAVYGYIRPEQGSNKLVVDEIAADVVKLIYQWKLDGQSANNISKKLNEMGVPSPMEYKKLLGMKYSTNFAKSGKAQWSAVAVFRILRDEVYTGVMIQGRYSTPNHKIRKKFAKPESEWARVEDMHEAIISLEDFELAARLLEKDTRTAPGADVVYPFSGVAACGLCGENMIRKTVKSNGKNYVYYVCCRSCKGSRMAEDVLTGATSMALHSHIGNIMNLERVLGFIDTLPLKQEDVVKLDSQIAARRDEIGRYEKLAFSLYESLEDGVISKDEYRMMKTRYNDLIEDAEQAIVSLCREIESIISNGGEKNLWIERFRQHKDFEGLTRRMVITLIDKVTVHPGHRLDILFRYRYDYERAVNIALNVNRLHRVPGAEALEVGA